MSSRRIWDLSQTLRPDLPVWPGDVRFSCAVTAAVAAGSTVNLHRLELSTHSGAHADAPLHFDPAGGSMETVDLVPYLGLAQLISVTEGPERIAEEEVLPRLVPGIRRVLLRTFEAFPHDVWPEAFRTPAPELVEALGAAGVRLIGMDGPSLDPQPAKHLASHLALGRLGMAVLEGLVLDGVEDGVWELIALPLPLAGADASPVRALLRDP